MRKNVFRKIFVFTFLFCSFAVWFSFAENSKEQYKRIISLAPSITETLFELGLGERVVGVTRFCDYPEEAKSIAKIGGFMDANYEEIVLLKPDLVILLTSHQEAKKELEKLEIKTLTVPHQTIEDIQSGMKIIGDACGAKDEAAGLIQDFNQRTQKIQKAVETQAKKKILICIGRDVESGQLAGMYMAGRNNFYDEIIELSGGVNAYEDDKVAYPQLSAESVIQLNPDVIIDLMSQINPKGKSPDEIAKQWNFLNKVSAVKNRQVFVIVGNHALRPGPRYIQFLEEMAPLVHPEAFQKRVEDE